MSLEQAFTKISDFGKLLTQLISSSSFSEPKLMLKNFTPPKINLTSMPSTDGIFSVESITGVNPFASGTYELTNVVINDDDLIDETYTWRIVNPNIQCDLTIVKVDIKDSTTSDYYYTYADYYTPVPTYPNPQLIDSGSTVDIVQPILYTAMNYFNAIDNNSSETKSALFYVKVGPIPEVCILKELYINGIKLPVGMSLRFLLAITVASRSSVVNYQIAILTLIYNLASNAYTTQSTSSSASTNHGSMPLTGYKFLTSLNGTDVAVGLFSANTPSGGPQRLSSSIIDDKGYVNVLFVLVSLTENSYESNFV